MNPLTPFQCDILRAIQNPLPLCDRPFEQLAAALHTTEQSLLDEIRRLSSDGLIRRFRPRLRYRALGRTAVLAASAVPEHTLEQTAALVSALPEVSHNYQRSARLNLWFTLQGQSLADIDAALDRLRQTTGLPFFSFPAETVYKLDVRFDPAGPGQDWFKPGPALAPLTEPIPAELTPEELLAVKTIQQELPIVARPFDQLLKMVTEKSPVSILKSLSDKGILDKIAAVLNYPRLGYTANAMFCAAAPAEHIDVLGAALAAIPAVTHCYHRRACSGWPYALYAMLHADTRDRIAAFIQDFCRTHCIAEFILLPTVREFKKAPVTL